MNRREFLTNVATKAAGGAVIGLAAGCTFGATPAAQEVQQATAQDAALPELKWEMATSWTPAVDILYGTAQLFTETVSKLTSGKFVISARAAGELAPGTQVLDVVQQGAVPIGHTASYYYIGKTPAAAFGTTLPFGLTAQQQNAWLYAGGGLELIQKLYADKFNVLPIPAGNTGMQMGGWFRKEINTVADLQGLKMRIAGLGGQVMAKLGVNVQVLAAGEIFQALQTGAVDAAEWVGPYDDEKLGLNTVADYYYRPGWWEPGSSLEVNINLDEWNKLPELYQVAIETAAAQSNVVMLSRYEAANDAALGRLIEGGAQLREYSPEIMTAASEAWLGLVDEFSTQDADFKAIYEQWNGFRNSIYDWNKTNEYAFTSFVFNAG
ncbi:MAG: TRAP transporter substrate-binding protein DctP [Caldilineaceae bacterium]|jgi:TRAP-type mannitol/chloroaromatic compound transport system substrate-binding protein|nr:TRAP transporter substrate-binding protein DctP [Caldilineaceae bacterium]